MKTTYKFLILFSIVAVASLAAYGSLKGSSNGPAETSVDAIAESGVEAIADENRGDEKRADEKQGDEKQGDQNQNGGLDKSVLLKDLTPAQNNALCLVDLGRFLPIYDRETRAGKGSCTVSGADMGAGTGAGRTEEEQISVCESGADGCLDYLYEEFDPKDCIIAPEKLEGCTFSVGEFLECSAERSAAYLAVMESFVDEGCAFYATDKGYPLIEERWAKHHQTVQPGCALILEKCPDLATAFFR